MGARAGNGLRPLRLGSGQAYPDLRKLVCLLTQIKTTVNIAKLPSKGQSLRIQKKVRVGLLRVRDAERLLLYSSESTTSESRRTSPTDHAWKGHPRGVWGASPSAISETWPRPASSRWQRSGSRNRLRASRLASGVLPRMRTQASTNGPMSQGHTVPW